MTDMHSRIPFSFAKAFEKFGADLLLASHSFNEDPDKIAYGRKWSQQEIDTEIGLKNVYACDADQLFDNPPDVFMIMCYEQQADQLRIYEKIKEKSKLVFYSGNDNTGNYFNKQYCSNLIAADISSYAGARARGVNTIYYFPYIDYETFSYAGESDSNIMRSYINSYKRLFPGGYEISLKISEMMAPDMLWESVSDVHVSAIPDLMASSCLTLHNKELEGYGYAVIESMARGRPVCMYRQFSRNRSMENWCIEDQTAIMFDHVNQVIPKLKRYISDAEYRHLFQRSAAATIRSIIDNDRETQKLKDFMESL